MKIEKISAFSEEALKALQQLLPQLAPGMTITESWLREVVATPATHLFITRDEGEQITGTFTLTEQKIPTGLKVWLEDVVVDEQARGQGLGDAIVQYAIDYARKLGTKKLDLTSVPARVAANKLYRKWGFVLRETNVYRLRFE
jgi:GNAT superfamily N-acetyltransferase